MRILLYVALFLAAAYTGYVVGLGSGYELGRKIGRIDRMFEDNNIELKHNGEVEN